MGIDPLKYAKNRAYQFVEEQQQALENGTITEAEWFTTHNQFFTDHYLASDDPRGQSGHSGGEARYRYSRMLIIEAIHKDGTFLDVGCANGYLMESLERWLQGSGLALEFYGLDISEGLITLAKSRLPQWQERFFLGNALYWTPPVKYDFVHLMEVEYVPPGRQKEFVDHLFNHYLKPGGRLIFGPNSEERESREFEEKFRAWGYEPAGYCEKSHQSHVELARKLLWFDVT